LPSMKETGKPRGVGVMCQRMAEPFGKPCRWVKPDDVLPRLKQMQVCEDQQL